MRWGKEARGDGLRLMEADGERKGTGIQRRIAWEQIVVEQGFRIRGDVASRLVASSARGLSLSTILDLLLFSNKSCKQFHREAEECHCMLVLSDERRLHEPCEEEFLNKSTFISRNKRLMFFLIRIFLLPLWNPQICGPRSPS